MYSGIILDQGRVDEVVEATGGGKRIRIESPTLVGRLQNGFSINVSGVCLTVVDLDERGFSVDVMPQTLKLSTVDDWQAGDVVNLEPSLRLGDEVGGHFVYGHVDGLAEIVEIDIQGNATIVMLRLPAELVKYIVPQGSVALDGVALTVVEVEDEILAISLTPETMARTTWSDSQVGDRVNVEVDMLIRYIERLVAKL